MLSDLLSSLFSLKTSWGSSGFPEDTKQTGIIIKGENLGTLQEESEAWGNFRGERGSGYLKGTAKLSPAVLRDGDLFGHQFRSLNLGQRAAGLSCKGNL